MTWQEGLARTLIGMLCALALLIILTPHDTLGDTQHRRVVPCLAISRVPAHCDPHR